MSRWGNFWILLALVAEPVFLTVVFVFFLFLAITGSVELLATYMPRSGYMRVIFVAWFVGVMYILC